MILPLLLPAILCWASTGGTSLAAVYARDVDRRLEFPETERTRYAEELLRALAGRGLDRAQYAVVVDCNEFIQTLMLYWYGPDQVFHFIGTSPVSAGKP